MQQEPFPTSYTDLYRAADSRPNGVTEYERDPQYGNYKIFDSECFCRVAIGTGNNGKVSLCESKRRYDSIAHLMLHIRIAHKQEWNEMSVFAIIADARNPSRASSEIYQTDQNGVEAAVEASYGRQVELICEAVLEDAGLGENANEACILGRERNCSEAIRYCITQSLAEMEGMDYVHDTIEDQYMVDYDGMSGDDEDISEYEDMEDSQDALYEDFDQMSLGDKSDSSFSEHHTETSTEGIATDDSASDWSATKGKYTTKSRGKEKSKPKSKGNRREKGKGKSIIPAKRKRSPSEHECKAESSAEEPDTELDTTPYEVRTPVLLNSVRDLTPPRVYLAWNPVSAHVSPFLIPQHRFNSVRRSLREINWESMKDETDAKPFRRFTDTQLYRIQIKFEDVKTQLAELNILYVDNNITTYESGSFFRCRSAAKKVEHLILKVIGPRIFPYDQVQDMREGIKDLIHQIDILQRKLGVDDV